VYSLNNKMLKHFGTCRWK